MKRMMLFLFLLAILILPCTLFAQQEKAKTPAAPADTTAQKTPNHTMPAQCMKGHGEMMSRMKEMDARLDEKVAAMDAATGDQKVEAMAAVIKEMVSQRKEMQEHMMNIHDMKKGHMMEHMKQGAEEETGKGKGM